MWPERSNEGLDLAQCHIELCRFVDGNLERLAGGVLDGILQHASFL